MASRAWAINLEALDRAREELEIVKPVRVLARHMKYSAGRYQGIKNDTHVITLGMHLSLWKASNVLWHELTHAGQCEQFRSVDKFSEVYNAQLEAVGLDPDRIDAYAEMTDEEYVLYSKIPFELEAYDNEKKYVNRKLVKPYRVEKTSKPSRVARIPIAMFDFMKEITFD